MIGLPKSAWSFGARQQAAGAGHVAPMGGSSRAIGGIMAPSRRGRDRHDAVLRVGSFRSR